MNYEEYVEYIEFFDDVWSEMASKLSGYELLRLLAFSDEDRINILKNTTIYPDVDEIHESLLDKVLSLYMGNREHMCRILDHLFTVPIDDGPLNFNHMTVVFRRNA